MWERAEYVVSAILERAEALRSRFAAPDRAASKGEGTQELHKAFQPRQKAEPADRRGQLREQFGQEQVSGPAKASEAHRQALRDIFREGQPKPKTPEQMRQAMQGHDKPAAARRHGKDKGNDQSK